MLSTLQLSHRNLSFNQMNVEPIVKKEDYLNLSSYSIKTQTIPDGWPLAEMLKIGNVLSRSHLSIEDGSQSQENIQCMIQVVQQIYVIIEFRKAAPSDATSSRRLRRKAIKPSSLPIELQNQRSRRTKTKLGRSSSRNHQPTTTATQDLPLVMGKRFMKVENIDLEELLVNFFFFSIFTAILIYLNQMVKSKIKEYAPLSEVLICPQSSKENIKLNTQPYYRAFQICPNFLLSFIRLTFVASDLNTRLQHL